VKTNTPVYVTKAYLPPFDEFVEELKKIWDSHILTNNGPIHNELVEQLKNYLKVSQLALFSNGHQALEIALKALDLKGEIITTPFTFASTTHAIVRSGLTPVFADIRFSDYNLDENIIESLITEKTSAILPVHVYGNPCNIEAIARIAEKHNLKIIYDAAHAFGVEISGKGIGEFGDISMFSFHATKVFNTMEGGALSFSDLALDRMLYLLKNFGIAGYDEVVLPGTNAKMNEFQALIGKINLKYVDQEIIKRQRAVEKYRQLLSAVPAIRLIPDANPSVRLNFAYFPILIDEIDYGLTRDALFDLLAEDNIFARKYFSPLITDFACYRDTFKPEIPIAKYVAERILTLPLWGDIPDDVIERICVIISNRGMLKK
jgi:dTDP-4-amino-4,6-dideoxygalactose transaminase